MFGHIDPLGAEEPQIGDGDREAHAPLLARLQQDLLEALQLADRARAAGHGIADVELDDLLAGDGAGVAHRDGRIEPVALAAQRRPVTRSEEHTSELQSLMRISYAVFCLKKKHKNK